VEKSEGGSRTSRPDRQQPFTSLPWPSKKQETLRAHTVPAIPRHPDGSGPDQHRLWTTASFMARACILALLAAAGQPRFEFFRMNSVPPQSEPLLETTPHPASSLLGPGRSQTFGVLQDAAARHQLIRLPAARSEGHGRALAYRPRVASL
jgi:hypothetical protein